MDKIQILETYNTMVDDSITTCLVWAVAVSFIITLVGFFLNSFATNKTFKKVTFIITIVGMILLVVLMILNLTVSLNAERTTSYKVAIPNKSTIEEEWFKEQFNIESKEGIIYILEYKEDVTE